MNIEDLEIKKYELKEQIDELQEEYEYVSKQIDIKRDYNKNWYEEHKLYKQAKAKENYWKNKANELKNKKDREQI